RGLLAHVDAAALGASVLVCLARRPARRGIPPLCPRLRTALLLRPETLPRASHSGMVPPRRGNGPGPAGAVHRGGVRGLPGDRGRGPGAPRVATVAAPRGGRHPRLLLLALGAAL